MQLLMKTFKRSDFAKKMTMLDQHYVFTLQEKASKNKEAQHASVAKNGKVLG